MIFKITKYFLIIFALLSILIFIGIYIGSNYPGSRPLTLQEKNITKKIYGESVNFSKVRIVFDSIYSFDSSKTLGNTIHIRIPDSFDRNIDMAKSLELQYLLIHELGHVFQYQKKGWGYIPKSLSAQLLAFIKTGSRSNAYNWKEKYKSGVSWEKFNPEEQASAISDYFYYTSNTNISQQDNDIKIQLECFIPILKS